MKFLVTIAFVALVATAAADDPPPKRDHDKKHAAVREAVDKCKVETDAPEDVVEKVRNHESIEDPKGWCFEKCMCSTLGVCDGDFKLVAEKFLKKEKAPADKVNAAVTKCNELTGANDCETVHKRFKCLFEEVPEVKRHRNHRPDGQGHGRRGPPREKVEQE